MRTITVTEKYRAVNEGRMSKAEFVRQMRQAYPMYVSPVGTYDSTVQILKNKNMLFEEKEQEVDDTFKYSDDSLRRAIDIELEAMGLMSYGNVSMDDQVKAKKKAIANLKKDPLHYYHLISGDSSKVDKHDKEVEVKRGALEVDTFNGMKKATLKEAKLMTEGTRALVGYLSGDRLTTTYNHYDGYPENLGKGLETHYNNDEKAKEIAMKGYITYLNPETGEIEATHNDSPTKIKLPDEAYEICREIAEEIDSMGADYGYIWDDQLDKWATIKNTGIRSMIDQILDKLVNKPARDMDHAMQGINPDLYETDIEEIDTSLDPYEDKKEIIRQVIQLIKSSMPADNEVIKDFIRTHYDDIINSPEDMAILDEFQEFLSVNYEYPSDFMQELKDTQDGRDIGGKIIEFADGKNVDVFVSYHRYKTKEFYDIPVEKAIDITNEYIDQNDLTQADTGQKDYILMIDDGDTTIDIKKADKLKWGSDEIAGLYEKKGKDHDEEILAYIADTYIQNAKDGDRAYAAFRDLHIRDAVQDVVGILQDPKHPLHDETKEEYQIVSRDKARGLFEKKGKDHDGEILAYIADTYIQNAKDGDRRYADFLDLNIRDAVQDVLGILQSPDHPLHDETKEEYQIVSRDKARGLFEKKGKVDEGEVDFDVFSDTIQVVGYPKTVEDALKVIDRYEKDREAPVSREEAEELIADMRATDEDDFDRNITNLIEKAFNIKLKGVSEKKGKDHDGDGDVDGDDYMAAKDKAIKKAMGKKANVNEAVKNIITKVLEEQTLNEAATNELARIADEYGSFEGLKPAVIALENIVTEIESFYDKTRAKIQKIYDDLGEVRNDEGLKVGAFITPSIENAFVKDLKHITKQQFHGGLDMPKVKRISQADVDRGYIQQEAPKTTVFTPVNEKKQIKPKK